MNDDMSGMLLQWRKGEVKRGGRPVSLPEAGGEALLCGLHYLRGGNATTVWRGRHYWHCMLLPCGPLLLLENSPNLLQGVVEVSVCVNLLPNTCILTGGEI